MTAKPKAMRIRTLLFLAAAVPLLGIGVFGGSRLPNPLITFDETGLLGTYTANGSIDITNPFFQNLGTNDRTCNSCHVSSQGWGISAKGVRERFEATRGTDPIFRPVDGSNCPSADVSTVRARRSAYSLLMSKGLIRISLPVPVGADFQITDIQDPYHCPQTTAAQPAMYRRPLPATNLPFLTTVMWDGRESPKGQSLTADLTQQALHATTGHAQGTPPSSDQLQQIVAFETGLFTAQLNDFRAGSLTAQGATGGPVNLASQNFYVGINDPLGGDPTGTAFNPAAFTTYDNWATLTGRKATPARESIARGEVLFNSFPIALTGVAGLNDLPGLSTINGTCTTCHDAPNVGDHSLALALNIGVTDYPARGGLDISGLPVYTITCINTGDTVQTTDPARAVITGKCADVGKTKGPILRGLAARAPYFHNGSAATLGDVVEFYNQRFNLNLTEQQKADLVAFLQTL
jgi:cytochrome c peroxidase